MLLLSLALCALSVFGDDGPSKTLILTDSNFGSVHVKPTFVKFYAPWCGHCVHLAPTIEELAEEFNSGSVATIAKIDCTVYSSICNEHGVQGYPTLKFFHDGEVSDYSGGRTKQAISKFIHELLAPLKEESTNSEGVAKPENGLFVGTEANFDSLLNSKGTVFVKFFAPWCGHCKTLAPTWEALAEKVKNHNDIKIVHVDCTSNGGVCSRFGVRGYPTLIVFQNGKEVEKYNGARDLASLSQYVIQQSESYKEL